MLSTLPSFLLSVTSAGDDVAERDREGELIIFNFGDEEEIESSAGLGGRTSGTVAVVMGTDCCWDAAGDGTAGRLLACRSTTTIVLLTPVHVGERSSLPISVRFTIATYKFTDHGHQSVTVKKIAVEDIIRVDRRA
jgi:hypothetical protein